MIFYLILFTLFFSFSSFYFRCKNFNNLNCFFAIVVGLMNGAVTRLKQTWEVRDKAILIHSLSLSLFQKVPVKLRRRYEQFEALMDPSRNHRVLRAYQHKLQPPIIPFMPLIVKGNECRNYLKLFLSLSLCRCILLA